MKNQDTLNHSIFRFKLTGRKSTVDLPTGAIVTGFTPSSEGFNLYALVCADEGAKTEKRAFAVAKVGEPLPVSATVSARPCQPLTIPSPNGGITILTLFEINKCDSQDWKAF
tara:strand:- start:25571 stop:25906 length:336 start_codon:yes stop_codon:yes gene_type:complete